MARPPDAGGVTRVLFIHTATLPPLGADTWIHTQIIRHLDRAAHELHVACRTSVAGAPTPTYDALADVPNVHVVPVDFGPELSGRSAVGKLRGLVATLPALAGLARLAALIRRRRIRIVHTSDRPRDAFATVLLARLTGARSIVHVHVGYNPEWMGWMLRWSLARADALIAISEYVAGTLERGRHDRARIHVVLNAIDVRAWSPGVGRDEVRGELGIGTDGAVVTTVCRLFPEKGPAELIRAFAAVRPIVPDAALLVVGTPTRPGYDDELVALARQLGVDGSVRFLGRRGDVGAVLAASDVFAMPSHEEPFGLVFVEAMAMRLPVVGLADGGTVEVVDDGSGLLSAWHDVEALTANLRTLLEDPELRREMGEHGRRRAVERFDVTRMAIDVAQVYRLVVSATA